MKSFLKIFFLIIFIVSAGYSGFHMYTEKEQYRISENLYTDISRDNTMPFKEIVSEGLSPPITVDFDKLREINPDVTAWLYCEEADINYPVVQGKDNEFYLHTMFDGTSNSAGTLFADYRCKLADPVMIIYGHNMKNGSMFGRVPSAVFDNNSILWYITPKSYSAFHLVAGRVVAEDSDIYTLAGSNDISVVSSILNTKSYDKYMILSTCSYEYDGARYILIGGYNSQ